jgi:hypothetical protein
LSGRGQIQPRRNSSTTPLQALNLLNSAFLLEQSAAFAERLQREAGSVVSAQVQRAYALAFARDAEPEELIAPKTDQRPRARRILPGHLQHKRIDHDLLKR